MNGHDGTPPSRCAPSVIDLGTGQWIAMAVLAALLATQKGHAVKRIETALLDTAFALVPYQATTARMTGQRPKRAGSGNPIAATYQTYTIGDDMLLIAAPSQRLWERLVAVLGSPQLLSDSRFTTVADRSANSQVLDQEITRLLTAGTADDWMARLKEAGIPVTRVAGLEQAVRSEIARERGTFVKSEDVPLVRLPWLVDGGAVPWARPVPHLGEHKVEILRELNYDDAAVAGLLRDGAVRTFADARTDDHEA